MKIVTITSDCVERLHGFHLGLTAYPRHDVRVLYSSKTVLVVLIRDVDEETPAITFEDGELGPGGWKE